MLPGTALSAGFLLTAASARAEPPLPAPAAPVAVAPSPPPPPYVLATSQPQYPRYTYVPGPWSSSTPGLPAAPSKRGWYGWQTLIVFGVSASITLTGLITESAVGTDGAALLAIPFAGAGFVLGGPVVHWAHGNIGRGFGVLGLNIGAPAVTAGLGVGIACASGACSRSGDGAGIFLSLVLGGSAGLLAAMIVDVSVLSHGSNTPVAASALNKAPGWMILPDLHISREKTTFGVVGAF